MDCRVFSHGLYFECAGVEEGEPENVTNGMFFSGDIHGSFDARCITVDADDIQFVANGRLAQGMTIAADGIC